MAWQWAKTNTHFPGWPWHLMHLMTQTSSLCSSITDIRESRLPLTNRLIKSYPQECMGEMRKFESGDRPQAPLEFGVFSDQPVGAGEVDPLGSGWELNGTHLDCRIWSRKPSVMLMKGYKTQPRAKVPRNNYINNYINWLAFLNTMWNSLLEEKRLVSSRSISSIFLSG